MTEKQQHPIGLGLTLFYTSMVLFFYVLIQNAVLKHFLNQRPESTQTEEDYQALIDLLTTDATVLSSGIILGSASAILFLVLLIRFRKVDVKQHLMLQPFVFRDVFNWLIVLIALSIFFTLISWLISHETPEFMLKLWASRDNTILLLLAILIAAPIFEECLFRGFLFSGVQNSYLGTGGAIVFSAGFWTMIHSQYGSFELITLFILGVVLAISRIATGSLYVPIILHASNNLFAVLGLALFTKNVAQ